MRRMLSVLAGVLLLAPALCWGTAGEVKALGAHRLQGMDEFQRVIDTKCTLCHSRERVDVAMRRHDDLEGLEKRMIEKGAVLTKEDKTVLGTFWGDPLKK